MKLLLKILFFVLAIFQTNISEAKNVVFKTVVSEKIFSVNAVENKNELAIILENGFGISCKSGSKLLDYKNLVLASKATAAKGGLTNPQLVQKSATLAERAIGGTGGVAGTAKHQYANALLNRYQSIYGSRALETGLYFNKGVGNRGFLDVIDHTNGIIYDFKFGNAVMSPAQFSKYSRNFGLPIQVIRP
jgi:hypothetical protein